MVYALNNACFGVWRCTCGGVLLIDMSIGNRFSYTLTGLWLLCAAEWKAKILECLNVSVCNAVQSRASKTANGKCET